MAAQSHALPADIRVLHMNIVEKMKISKSFETLFSYLKRCLAVSVTFLHSDKTIFREKINRVASLNQYVIQQRRLYTQNMAQKFILLIFTQILCDCPLSV